MIVNFAVAERIKFKPETMRHIPSKSVPTCDNNFGTYFHYNFWWATLSIFEINLKADTLAFGLVFVKGIVWL